MVVSVSLLASLGTASNKTSANHSDMYFIATVVFVWGFFPHHNHVPVNFNAIPFIPVKCPSVTTVL